MENLNIYASKVVKSLNDATIVSRMAHWNVRGSNFYEAHLLFERIYNDLGELMDGLIETFRAFGYNPDFAQFSGPGISMQNYDCHYLGNLIPGQESKCRHHTLKSALLLKIYSYMKLIQKS